MQAAAVYKRSTMPIFKAHGLAQSSMSDCVSETISAIRTVRSYGGEKRQMSAFGNQIFAYKASGIQLGTYKSINESVTRVKAVSCVHQQPVILGSFLSIIFLIFCSLSVALLGV
ncbi:ABC transporter B family member 28-like isoform X1 [Beta vulgaris subsp. vulgaris]|uniref:ABC transporter B family member 28-like isoform X1 n=1 Tax=Beta vulgaris subsp. vulgaris TaxID=3555 RepID=UPI0020369E97|nr:ABC transporter B family member 28-like isoform X1 [Beta vulgaris subsp. vulgaris]XP_057247182.1 ABC transporter B family member 28-like isoform X1 [Beta vulgaris subsp. vulgaris]